jgi:hypothetical protein
MVSRPGKSSGDDPAEKLGGKGRGWRRAWARCGDVFAMVVVVGIVFLCVVWAR